MRTGPRDEVASLKIPRLFAYVVNIVDFGKINCLSCTNDRAVNGMEDGTSGVSLINTCV